MGWQWLWSHKFLLFIKWKPELAKHYCTIGHIIHFYINNHTCSILYQVKVWTFNALYNWTHHPFLYQQSHLFYTISLKLFTFSKQSVIEWNNEHTCIIRNFRPQVIKVINWQLANKIFSGLVSRHYYTFLITEHNAHKLQLSRIFLDSVGPGS